MKTKVLKFIFAVAIAAFLVPGISRAGNEGGAGGNGMLIDGKPYLLDLVEYGIENNPYIEPGYVKHKQYASVKSILDKLADSNETNPFQDSILRENLTLKILEIGSVHSQLALSVLWALQAHSWYIVNKALIDAWAGTSSLIVSDRISLAVRNFKEIRINRAYWNQLDPMNKTALILHEAIYSILYPDGVRILPNGNLTKRGWQDSNKVRRTIGTIFQRNYSKSQGDTLLKVVSDETDLPIVGPIAFYQDVAYGSQRLQSGSRYSESYYSKEDAIKVAENFCARMAFPAKIYVTLSQIESNFYSPSLVKPAGFYLVSNKGPKVRVSEVTDATNKSDCILLATNTFSELVEKDPYLWAEHP